MSGPRATMARILIVEDEFLIALSVAAALQAEEHEVQEARDGRRALELLRGFRPDVVVTDYMMPRMDGAELIRSIRNMPGLDGVQIVLMSAVPENTLAAERLAYDAFLQKPFREDELVALVGEAIARRRSSG
ncbi:MAG TPA: response regulator [Geminicoccaceae bacterium]|nr:response regulator [Geminicoccaceae bacterium]